MIDKTVVIVPVFNENYRAVKTIKDVLNIFNGEVIVIDDGSFDNSHDLLLKEFQEKKRVWLLKHELNLGKGAAMKTGVLMAKKIKAKAVIFIDSDGQHQPKMIPEFEKRLNNFDLVFGYRELSSKMPIIRKLGNLIAKKIIEYLFGVKRKDFLCGYLGFNMKSYNKIKWYSNRYGVETEIATKVARNHLSYDEIKIDTIYVDKYKGVSLIDAFKVLLKIPSWYFIK